MEDYADTINIGEILDNMDEEEFFENLFRLFDV